jgi:hypothetical protein
MNPCADYMHVSRQRHAAHCRSGKVVHRCAQPDGLRPKDVQERWLDLHRCRPDPCCRQERGNSCRSTVPMYQSATTPIGGHRRQRLISPRRATTGPQAGSYCGRWTGPSSASLGSIRHGADWHPISPRQCTRWAVLPPARPWRHALAIRARRRWRASSRPGARRRSTHLDHRRVLFHRGTRHRRSRSRTSPDPLERP